MMQLVVRCKTVDGQKCSGVVFSQQFGLSDWQLHCFPLIACKIYLLQYPIFLVHLVHGSSQWRPLSLVFQASTDPSVCWPKMCPSCGICGLRFVLGCAYVVSESTTGAKTAPDHHVYAAH